MKKYIQNCCKIIRSIQFNLRVYLLDQAKNVRISRTIEEKMIPDTQYAAAFYQ